MQLTIRPRDRQDKLNKSLLSWIAQLFQKLDRFLPDTANVDIQLEHIRSRKQGKTHYVHATAAIPGGPTTLYVETLAEDFRSACDQVYDKLEKQLRRHRDRIIRARRQQGRKEALSDWVHQTLSRPKRLLDRFRGRPADKS